MVDGLSVGNSGGASTELGSGIPSYMSRVSMVSVSNGLLSIPNDQQLVFEDGVPYLRQSQSGGRYGTPSTYLLRIICPQESGERFLCRNRIDLHLAFFGCKVCGQRPETEQKLHYLGIPLKANWNFLDKKLFTLYVSGGGMIEKCVYGKLGTEKETVKPLQFSVSGAVGAQFNATKRVGIYVMEPGVAFISLMTVPMYRPSVRRIRISTNFNIHGTSGYPITYWSI